MNRRSFLSVSGSLSGTAMLVSTMPCTFASESPPAINGLAKAKRISHSTTQVDTGLSRRQWNTIAAVQQHLFPSDVKSAVPGAKDINAKAYLYAVLAEPGRDDADRKLVKNGLIGLQDICWKQHQQLFTKLSQQQREQCLRLFEKKADGRLWLMTILGYIFEALLVDPIYGGNPDEIGWKWLEHKNGFPRPTADKAFYLL